ncbi:ATP synthase protein I [Oikeobacillus pervagus]|uniref:ATP synthase protein I n=1 Tax=Oikeobacillus pervagus TaxID=1325931 RepID=A0AAJ1WIA2_9BACI|nr:ATP synthase subunit I [Oikeobacillus pervagus]MDQ0214138.1 ATP synthase protein I [Oikeobacillus pervagus]
MQELHQMLNRHRKYIFSLLALYCIGWGVTEYKTIFLGLILGTSISLLNHWLMIKRISRFGDAVVAGQRVRTLGTFSRMAWAVFAVIIALELPDHFHFISVILGLMTSYIVIMIDFIIQSLIKRKNGEER